MAVEQYVQELGVTSFADGEHEPLPNREKSYHSFAPNKTCIALTFALCTDESITRFPYSSSFVPYTLSSCISASN